MLSIHCLSLLAYCSTAVALQSAGMTWQPQVSDILYLHIRACQNPPQPQLACLQHACVLARRGALQYTTSVPQAKPLTAGPLLDDVEKQRLAEWMRYKGKPPELKASQAPPRKPKPGSKADLQNLFDQIVVEVNERQQYLQDMTAHTSTKDHQAVSNQMKREIQDRVQEMKRLDELLKSAQK